MGVSDLAGGEAICTAHLLAEVARMGADLITVGSVIYDASLVASGVAGGHVHSYDSPGDIAAIEVIITPPSDTGASGGVLARPCRSCRRCLMLNPKNAYVTDTGIPRRPAVGPHEAHEVVPGFGEFTWSAIAGWRTPAHCCRCTVRLAGLWLWAVSVTVIEREAGQSTHIPISVKCWLIRAA
jgi:hypothetical protein